MKLIGLPCGRAVTVAEYVRSWRMLRNLDRDRPVERWSHFPTPAGEILDAIRARIHDRINRHLPDYGRGLSGTTRGSATAPRSPATSTPRG